MPLLRPAREKDASGRLDVMAADGIVSEQSSTGGTVCVVLDTNQWFASLLLRSAAGAALLHTLGRAGGTIAVPEVVDRELRAKVDERGRKALRQAQQAIEDIQRLLGTVREWTEPSADEFVDATDGRYRELGDLLKPVALKHEHTLDRARPCREEGAPNDW